MPFRYPDDRRCGQVPKSSAGCVPVHPCATAVQQDRAVYPIGDGAIDRPPDRGWQRDEGDAVVLADDPQDAVAVFFTEVGDLGAGSFADAQAEEPEHGDQGEVIGVRGLAGGGQECFELQVG